MEKNKEFLPGSWVMTLQRIEDHPNGPASVHVITGAEADAINDGFARSCFNHKSFIKNIQDEQTR